MTANNIQKGGSMTKNQIDYWNLVETERANKARENENYRSNRAKEELQRQQNSNTLAIGMGNLGELNRSNLARELENNRSNMTREQIAQYEAALKALELPVKQQQADASMMQARVALGNLAEVQRSNRANEAIKWSNLDEVIRDNTVNQEERERSNRRNEEIQNFKVVSDRGQSYDRNTIATAQQTESARHNQAMENETKRNNLINQQLEAAGLMQKIQHETAQDQNALMNTMMQPMRFLKYK